ncbi:tetratricopeptide repeat protein [Micromonospora sp. NPDC049301]|uniref:tetratricopeptide repeat protein n=1 Tax=Micromonospora sp. NPDC049301 TaxID=3155723 RepID=UPI0034435ADA
MTQVVPHVAESSRRISDTTGSATAHAWSMSPAWACASARRATTRANLATWKGRAGDHNTAITQHEQLLTDRLRVLGPDHPDTLTTRGHLAHLLLGRGAVLAARAQVTAKLEAERRLFGPRDHRTQRTQELLNEITTRMGGRARRSNTKRRKH